MDSQNNALETNAAVGNVGVYDNGEWVADVPVIDGRWEYTGTYSREKHVITAKVGPVISLPQTFTVSKEALLETFADAPATSFSITGTLKVDWLKYFLLRNLNPDRAMSFIKDGERVGVYAASNIVVPLYAEFEFFFGLSRLEVEISHVMFWTPYPVAPRVSIELFGARKNKLGTLNAPYYWQPFWLAFDAPAGEAIHSIRFGNIDRGIGFLIPQLWMTPE